MISSEAKAEWRKNWAMVIAAMAGFSVSTLGVHSMGLFIGPIGTEFGWSRATTTSSLTIFAILAAPLAPVAGFLIDRLGSRRLAVPGIILFSTTFASLGTINGSIWMWWGLWCLLALCSITVHTAVWTTAIAQRFSTGRGLALAITLSGTSLTQIIAPPLTNYLIAGWGWRSAYITLGLGWGAVALTLVVLFFHDFRSVAASKTKAAAGPAILGGLTLGDAMRSVRIWRIAAAELLVSTINVSLIVHMVPLLEWRGLTLTEAARVAGLVGFFAIAGKVITGVLLDRGESRWLPAISLWLPSIACLLVMNPGNLGALAYVAAAVFGYAVGAYFQIITYLTSRYAGLANFGQIFGIMAGLMAVGTGIGPLAASGIFDLTGAYTLWLLACIGMSTVAGCLVFNLGRYPDWPPASVR